MVTLRFNKLFKSMMYNANVLYICCTSDVHRQIIQLLSSVSFGRKYPTDTSISVYIYSSLEREREREKERKKKKKEEEEESLHPFHNRINQPMLTTWCMHPS